MKNDTPRMSEAWRAPGLRPDGFHVMAPPIGIAMSVMAEGKKLEIELVEMTRQRDEARAHAEQFRRYIRDADPDAILPLFLPWDYLNQTTP